MSTENVDIVGERSYVPSMLTPEQSRAARGWLDWSQDDLAKKAQVSPSTVRDFEKKRRVPIANNLDAIIRAFATEGITFEQGPDGRPLGIKANQALSA